MVEFKDFLDWNINQINSENNPKFLREGVYASSFLFSDPDSFGNNTVFKYRFLYIRNLCLKEPIVFTIPENISKYEKSLMFLSFNNISDALKTLNTNFSCEVIGTKARTRTGAIINVPVLSCLNTASNTEFEYTANGYTYDEYKVQPLSYEELIYCYIKIIDILKNEDNDTLKKFKLKAYLNRVLGEENQLNLHFKRAFLIILAEIENSTEELFKIKDLAIPIDEILFLYPITFKFDLLIQLGLAYKNRYYFKEAYECLFPYPYYIERIDCLIGLRKSEEAANEINSYIKMIVEENEEDDKPILCDLYIKLGHLYQDSSYFDLAFQTYRCTKPLHLKGIFYFKRKEYDLANLAFEAALKLTPQDEKIRFSYGCSLIESERINEAIVIFKDLRIENPMDEKISKNLSYCYYKQNDIENTLSSLRRIALADSMAMNNYFMLSIKNEKIENICWALSKISAVELVRGGVNYMIENEIREILKSNPYIDINDIFI